MIRMATWRSGGRRTPPINSWSCPSASSISTATFPGTWPMVFTYVSMHGLIIPSGYNQTKIQSNNPIYFTPLPTDVSHPSPCCFQRNFSPLRFVSFFFSSPSTCHFCVGNLWCCQVEQCLLSFHRHFFFASWRLISEFFCYCMSTPTFVFSLVTSLVKW